MSQHEKIKIELSRSDALVLYEYLRRCDDAGQYAFIDPAEERVVWDLEIMLQPLLSEVMAPNFSELIDAARAQVRERCEE